MKWFKKILDSFKGYLTRHLTAWLPNPILLPIAQPLNEDIKVVEVSVKPPRETSGNLLQDLLVEEGAKHFKQVEKFLASDQLEKSIKKAIIKILKDNHDNTLLSYSDVGVPAEMFSTFYEIFQRLCYELKITIKWSGMFISVPKHEFNVALLAARQDASLPKYDEAAQRIFSKGPYR